MKWKLVLLTLSILFTTTILFAQTDKLVGIWLNQEKEAQIQIFKDAKSQKFYGKIVWLSMIKVILVLI